MQRWALFLPSKANLAVLCKCPWMLWATRRYEQENNIAVRFEGYKHGSTFDFGWFYDDIVWEKNLSSTAKKQTHSTAFIKAQKTLCPICHSVLTQLFSSFSMLNGIITHQIYQKFSVIAFNLNYVTKYCPKKTQKVKIN